MLPFLLPHPVTATGGVVGALAVMLSVGLGCAGVGNLHDAVLDGDVLVWPTTRGVREIDLARLRSVDGRRLRSHEHTVDVLQAVDEAGGTLDLSSQSGFADGRSRNAALRHVLHRRIAERVAAGQVPVVTPSALVVLGLPPGSVRTTRLPLRPHVVPMLLAVPALAVIVTALMLYVHLLSLVGLGKAVF